LTKVLDSFLFTHEFDILELRLRLLWPVVDKFLLMEGDHNFRHQPKPMRFNEQKARFEWAAEKLVHVQHIGKFRDGSGDLFIENQHRQCLYDNAKALNFDPDDILLTSDVDEIPSREVIERFKNEDFVSPTICSQEFYYYNINCHRGKKWLGTVASRFSHDLGKIGEMRQHRKQMASIQQNCGWHFTHFYDSEGIREKLLHSSHAAYNSEHYYGKAWLADCVKQNRNYLGKADGDRKPEPLPQYLLDEVKKFPIMMGEFK